MCQELLVGTASRRALAEIINMVSVEIVGRRDTSKTVVGKEILSVLHTTYKALMFTWNDLMDTDPVTYAYVWDTMLTDLSVDIMPIVEETQEIMRSIVNDISFDVQGLLPVICVDDFAEASLLLTNIVEVDKSFQLLSRV